jgi:hypothetical protein
MYHLEEVTGLLFTVPFVLFSVVAIARTKVREPRRHMAGEYPTASEDMLAWTYVCLTGASILPFLAILPYFYVTMRFQADFMPCFVILSTLGLWHGYGCLRARSGAQSAYVLFACLLAALSIAMSVSLPLAVFYRRYQYLNPSLFRELLRGFKK